MNDTSARVRSVIAATFGIAVDTITPETGSNTIETWDSMNHIHLVVALEGEFDVSFEPEQALELTSVRAIEQVLAALGVR